MLMQIIASGFKFRWNLVVLETPVKMGHRFTKNWFTRRTYEIYDDQKMLCKQLIFEVSDFSLILLSSLSYLDVQTHFLRGLVIIKYPALIKPQPVFQRPFGVQFLSQMDQYKLLNTLYFHFKSHTGEGIHIKIYFNIKGSTSPRSFLKNL